MKLEKEYIDQIHGAFRSMVSKQDFLDLLNFTKEKIYGNNAIPFSLRQLNYYINPNNSGRHYHKFTIRKRSGAERSIHAPEKGLKTIQKVLSVVLQCVFDPHEAATGFVWNRSVADNARLHVGRRYVYNIDLKDFFPSIDQARIWKCLQLKPFFLINEKDGKFSNQSRGKIAGMIAALCCTEMEVDRMKDDVWKKEKGNVLPQGAPTSPVITNIVCQRLDHLLTGVAKRFGLIYSRYADDITFSSMHNVYQKDSEFIKELHRIIAEQRFQIKESKTRLQKEGHRKEVTGLLVNENVNVQKRYIKQLRMWLYLWERYGREKASVYFQKYYVADKGHIKKGCPDMILVIRGKIDYLKMVRGPHCSKYMDLKLRFDILQTDNVKEQTLQIELSDIVDLIFTVGLDKAMDLFKNNLYDV